MFCEKYKNYLIQIPVPLKEHYQKVSLQIPPFFPPAQSAGKFFSKEIPNKKILLQIPPPFFSRKNRTRGGIWSDTF